MTIVQHAQFSVLKLQVDLRKTCKEGLPARNEPQLNRPTRPPLVIPEVSAAL